MRIPNRCGDDKDRWPTADRRQRNDCGPTADRPWAPRRPTADRAVWDAVALVLRAVGCAQDIAVAASSLQLAAGLDFAALPTSLD